MGKPTPLGVGGYQVSVATLSVLSSLSPVVGRKLQGHGRRLEGQSTCLPFKVAQALLIWFPLIQAVSCQAIIFDAMKLHPLPLYLALLFCCPTFYGSTLSPEQGAEWFALAKRGEVNGVKAFIKEHQGEADCIALRDPASDQGYTAFWYASHHPDGQLANLLCCAYGANPFIPDSSGVPVFFSTFNRLRSKDAEQIYMQVIQALTSHKYAHGILHHWIRTAGLSTWQRNCFFEDIITLPFSPQQLIPTTTMGLIPRANTPKMRSGICSIEEKPTHAWHLSSMG